MARALGAAQGLGTFQVRSNDDDGDGLRRSGRLSAYLIAQRALLHGSPAPRQPRHATAFAAAFLNLAGDIAPAAIARALGHRRPAQRLRLFAREALGDEQAEVPKLLTGHLRRLDNLTPGDVATVCRQRDALGEAMTPEQFLPELVVECRLKQAGAEDAA